MPIFYQQDIDGNTKLGIWKIEEEESFFLSSVPLQREISHPHKRLQHLAGRYLLQYLFPGFPLNLVKVASTLKPFLEDEAFHFSISHCGDYAAVIVSKNARVGVDIEIPDNKVARIRHKFLNENENIFLSGFSSELKHLTLLWSCKEAVFKWWSFGKVDFRNNIHLFPLTLNDKGSIQTVFNVEEKRKLDIQYQVFDEICLAYICTPA